MKRVCAATGMHSSTVVALCLAPLTAAVLCPQLYMWEFTKEGAQPQVVLKTRRSLRAVHFQPHGVPLLLTAEVRAAPDKKQIQLGRGPVAA